MQKIEYDGEIYYYMKGRFVDSSYIEVEETTKNKLAELFFLKVDYKSLEKDELIAFVKEVKEAEQFNLAKDICLYCLETYKEDVCLIKNILPIITSCYRMCGQPEKAISVSKEFALSFKYESVAFLTSLVAAYCDIKDYENAKRYAKKAYARQGGGTGEKTELSLVFMRIKKEAGEKDI